MITLITRHWYWLLVSLVIPLWLAGCGGGGGGGGGGSATGTAAASSSTATTPATGFVDARATNKASGLQIEAPISILLPDGSTKTGTGRVISIDNLPVGSIVTVTFGDFSGSGFADPQTNPVVITIVAGANLVTGAYEPLPPPP